MLQCCQCWNFCHMRAVFWNCWSFFQLKQMSLGSSEASHKVKAKYRHVRVARRSAYLFALLIRYFFSALSSPNCSCCKSAWAVLSEYAGSSTFNTSRYSSRLMAARSLAIVSFAKHPGLVKREGHCLGKWRRFHKLVEIVCKIERCIQPTGPACDDRLRRIPYGTELVFAITIFYCSSHNSSNHSSDIGKLSPYLSAQLCNKCACAIQVTGRGADTAA